MRNKIEGVRGESLAEGYLLQKGYKILGRNQKLMNVEVDLIAEDGDGTIAFVEVKTRETYNFGNPVEAVTPSKIARYKKFINLYSQIHKLYDRTLRIDVIAVSGEEVEHLIDVGS